ncbi:MAG: gliding motility lipoprotein GldH [Muribaculaceae bacterium]|nr:gliding motility lipoprotein GldH [Muribaculaceae bacterium]
MNRTAAIFVIVTMAVLSACRLRHNDYSDFHTFDNARWAFTDTVTFTPELADSVADVPLTICVRHSNAYPYSNLWLELQYPTGDTTVQTDTIELTLADDFGRWYGKGSGVSYQFTDTLSPRFRVFSKQKLRLRNIMRRDTLPGIEQIGILLGC